MEYATLLFIGLSLLTGFRSSFIFFMARFNSSALMVDWSSSISLQTQNFSANRIFRFYSAQRRPLGSNSCWFYKDQNRQIKYYLMTLILKRPIPVFVCPILKLLLAQSDLPLACLQIQPHMGTCWHCLA